MIYKKHFLIILILTFQGNYILGKLFGPDGIRIKLDKLLSVMGEKFNSLDDPEKIKKRKTDLQDAVVIADYFENNVAAQLEKNTSLRNFFIRRFGLEDEDAAKFDKDVVQVNFKNGMQKFITQLKHKISALSGPPILEPVPYFYPDIPPDIPPAAIGPGLPLPLPMPLPAAVVPPPVPPLLDEPPLPPLPTAKVTAKAGAEVPAAKAGAEAPAAKAGVEVPAAKAVAGAEAPKAGVAAPAAKADEIKAKINDFKTRIKKLQDNAGLPEELKYILNNLDGILKNEDFIRDHEGNIKALDNIIGACETYTKGGSEVDKANWITVATFNYQNLKTWISEFTKQKVD